MSPGTLREGRPALASRRSPALSLFMKIVPLYWILFSIGLMSALGNPVWANPVSVPPSRATLVGETVSVRLLADRAAVTAVYHFSGSQSTVRKRVYFPLFAAKAADPIAVLSGSSLELQVDDKIVGIAEPCEAPFQFSDMPQDADVYWFVAELEPLIAEAGVASFGDFMLRATYVQPLVHGRFYYIPLIRGLEPTRGAARSWNYQMLARAQNRMPMVSSKSDYEPLEDAVVIYLKNGELVSLE